jgi:hypothetical protein
MHQPVIACINGGCVGIGLSMAMACDLRFASEDAKIGVIFPQRGLIAEDGMGYFMPHLMGRCPPSPPLSYRRGEGIRATGDAPPPSGPDLGRGRNSMGR